MPFKYYDVETGTEREVEHGDSCCCGSCTRSRLKVALDDIIKASGAFAPSTKKKGPIKIGPCHKPFEYPKKHDWFGEPVINDEGKCFGWNPDIEFEYLNNGHEVYMILTNTPMSPDMTKNDMAVMSVDQARAVLTLKVLYNPFFNERLKKAIEPKYRNWNLANKCWELHPSKMKDVQAICGEFYKGVQIIGQKPVLGTKFEKLLVKLTKDDKAAIYRLMALKYHPDKGGSHETMSLLNEVFKQ
jgi:hypothetical protein